jgi:hypothetical protein
MELKKWYPHTELRVGKNVASINVNTKDFYVYVDDTKFTDEAKKEYLDTLEEDYFFTTKQVKSVINKCFKESGGEAPWRILHFINVEEELIIGKDFSFQQLRFYKIDSNKWVCYNSKYIVLRSLFDNEIFGDLKDSFEFSKEKGMIEEDADFRELPLAFKVSRNPYELMEDKLDLTGFDPTSIDNKSRKRRISAMRPIKRDKAKVYRNDPCPCGSGKKYKKCCL